MNPNSATPSAPAATRPGRITHRRTGKVACLPKSARDKLNTMLDDGVPYGRIIKTLGPDGAALTLNNISEWKLHGGYDDYLRDKFWREEVHARQETFTGLLTGADPLQVPEAGLQLAAIGACELLRHLSTLGTNPDGKPDPDRYVRVANSLSRLSRAVLTLQQYRDATSTAKALERKRPGRPLGDPERTALLGEADDLFGFKSAERLLAADPKILNPNLELQEPVAPIVNPAAATAPATINPPASETPVPPIENQNSKIQNPITPLESGILNLPSLPDSPAATIETSGAGPAIENQKSKIQNPKELCYDCGAILPLLRPDGQRPHRTCRACCIKLYPPNTPLQYCQFCNTANPLPPGEDPPSNCRTCRCALPPPGQRFLDRCPNCGLKLRNVTNLGVRLSDRCPDCRAPVPLLEPA